MEDTMQVERDRSFEDILENNKHKIYRLCRIYAVSPIEPQDLFQEIVYEVWRSFKSFKGKASIDTWIYRISLNVCLRSKIKLDKKNSHEARLESIQFIKADSEYDEDQEDKFQMLRSCISVLNEVDKSLIVLHLEELSYKDIGVITGLTENHVAVKMKRIRKKLFDCINLKMK